MAAVESWPQPRSTRGLRGFLKLVVYYRCFIQNFSTIAGPLTTLLKKRLTEAATEAFTALKKALSVAPVLHLPDFGREFIQGPFPS